MDELTFDVIIVGYGPVGATAANFLGMYGWKTAVFERDNSIYHLPRAINLNHEVMRIFQQLGLLKSIESVVTPIDGVKFLDAKKATLLNVKFEPTTSTQGFAPNYSFYQPELETKLRLGVARFDCVSVFLGHEVESINQDADSVKVSVRDLNSNCSLSVSSKYLLGCDGARSCVRISADLELHDSGFHRRQLVVDAFLKEKLLLPTIVQQYCNPKRPTVFVHSSQNHRRWEFALLNGETHLEMENPDKVKELLSNHGVDSSKLKIARAKVYIFHSMWAKQWRKGRIFLVGDAAHQMPPILGQGMCSGIRDSQNLSWKLNLVLHGKASSQILDSYQTERLPHVKQITKTATRMYSIFKTTNFLVAWLRNACLKVWPGLPNVWSNMPPLREGLFSYSTHSISRKNSVVGEMFMQPIVRNEKGELILLDEVLGLNWAILGLDINVRDLLTSELASFLVNLPTRFIKIVSREKEFGLSSANCETIEIEDKTHQLTHWFNQQQKSIVIIRPDRHIFGVYEQDEINQAVAELICLLHPEYKKHKNYSYSTLSMLN